MTLDGRKATTLVMLALFVGACLLALDLPAKAAFMPLLIGIPGILLCLAQLWLDFRRGTVEESAKSAVQTADDSGDNGRSEQEMLLWLGLFTAVLLGLGFLVGGPLIVILFIRLSSQDSWQNALFAGAGTFAVLYGTFTWLLEISLFRGFVLEWLLP